MITPLVETAPIGEEAFPQHAPQMNGDTSVLRGRPNRSPNDRSRSVATYSASGVDEEPGASMAGPDRPVSQSTQGTPPSEQEAARVAQVAWGIINQTTSGAGGAPPNQVHSSQVVSLVRQQEPAIFQDVPGIHTEPTSTETARQTSQLDDVFRVNAPVRRAQTHRILWLFLSRVSGWTSSRRPMDHCLPFGPLGNLLRQLDRAIIGQMELLSPQ
ncbi:hypothetical protein ACJZ2D_017208 [Fusarium nematophilum]